MNDDPLVVAVARPGVTDREPLFEDEDDGLRVALHDAGGAGVATLLDAELPAGVHSVRWDGRDAHRRRAPAGIYFVRVEAGKDAATARFVLLR